MIRVMLPKIIAIALLAIFYAAYFGKKVLQRRQGITTNQIGVGNKPKRTMLIERMMGIATLLIVPVEVLSIAVYPHWTLLSPLQDCPTMQWIGVALAAAGVAFFIIAMRTMADNWRAGIPEKDRTQLVQSGIYCISRNPAFVGFDLVYIGLLMAFPNLLHLLFALFAVVMLHLQILQEESFCRTAFGAQYDTYCRQVRRYL